MDQQKIDRLFREKMNQLEVAPTKGAWSQVEGQIQHKKKPLVYWVAAAVSLLVACWVIFPKTNHELPGTPIASIVNHPQFPGDELSIELPRVAPKGIQKDDSKPTVKKIPTQMVAKAKPVPIPKTTEEQLKQENALADLSSVDIKELIAEAEVNEPSMTKQDDTKDIKNKPQVVKITYIASNTQSTSEQDSDRDSTGVFKKVVAFAGKLDPGDMLADMKTVKDNLLNGGLRNRKASSSL